MNQTAAISASPPTSKGLGIGLWVVQLLLAAAFIMGGLMKITTPIEQLATQMPWVTGALGGAVVFIGVVEVLGGLGVLLPSATRIQPKLTVLAAVGLLTIMVLAAITHIIRGEFPLIAVNLVMGAMAAFVAWGRFIKAPIEPRK